MIQETLSKLSIPLEAPPGGTFCSILTGPVWMEPIMRYIEDGEVPNKPKEAAMIQKRASSYSVIDGNIYLCGFSTPLLNCLEGEEIGYMRELEDNILEAGP